MSDDYPAGDKDGLTHEQMISGVRDKGIDYYFSYIVTKRILTK